MKPESDIAIVLRSVPYEDRHRVVTALTEKHGQISALARNSIQSRRFGGSLEVFSAALWEFTQRPGAELVSLKEATIRRGFEGLRRDFERLSQAAVFNELMLKVAPTREACLDLFKLHSNALVALEEASGQGVVLPLLNAYFAKVLQWNGTQPRLDCCHGCKKEIDQITVEEELTCLIAEAGWLCEPCRRGGTGHLKRSVGEQLKEVLLRLSKTAIVDFQISLLVPVRQVTQAVTSTKQDQIALFHFLEALLMYHIPGLDREQLKGLKFLPELQT